MLTALFVAAGLFAVVLTGLLGGIAATIYRQDPAGQGVLLGAGVLTALVLGGVMAGLARIAWSALPEWAVTATWWGIPLAVVIAIACVTVSQRAVSVVLVAMTVGPAVVMVVGWGWFYFRG